MIRNLRVLGFSASYIFMHRGAAANVETLDVLNTRRRGLVNAELKIGYSDDPR